MKESGCSCAAESTWEAALERQGTWEGLHERCRILGKGISRVLRDSGEAASEYYKHEKALQMLSKGTQQLEGDFSSAAESALGGAQGRRSAWEEQHKGHKMLGNRPPKDT